MRISVTHSTAYRYEEPVYAEPHTFRLKPREDAAQHLLNYRVEIRPQPAGSAECLDQAGNVVLEAWFDAPLRELAVTSSFAVETLRDNPFQYLPAGWPPLVYPEPLRSALGPCLAAPPASAAVRDLADGAAREAGGNPLLFLTALNRTMFETLGHTVRADGPPLPPETTLREGEGTCRDLAVLFCVACRAAGIAARFVSGYEREAAFQARAFMHAWAEVYIPGGGWRGYDPSQGLAVSTSHIAVAAAADSRLAAPITGTFRGAARAGMQFAISMQVA